MNKPKDSPPGIYHVTWVTHNSRISQRMVDYHVKIGNGIWFDESAEVKITEIITDIILEKHYNIHAYNICKDHIHMLIESGENEINNTVRLIKGKSSQMYKEYLEIPAKEPFHLWAQKFNKWLIETEEQLHNTEKYILNNRDKHGLPQNKGLQPLVLRMMPSS
jgi:REP element-mobilizing transposase RayT